MSVSAQICRVELIRLSGFDPTSSVAAPAIILANRVRPFVFFIHTIKAFDYHIAMVSRTHIRKKLTHISSVGVEVLRLFAAPPLARR